MGFSENAVTGTIKLSILYYQSLIFNFCGELDTDVEDWTNIRSMDSNVLTGSPSGVRNFV